MKRMKMKYKPYLILFFMLTYQISFSQCNDLELLKEPIKKIIDNDEKWEILELGTIFTIRYKPSFPSKVRQKEQKKTLQKTNYVDSTSGLFISLRFEPNWNTVELNKSRQIRAKFIDSVKAEYINHYNKVGWKNNSTKKTILK